MPTANPIDFPDNTESIHNIGNFVLSMQNYQNAFLDALVNRIGRVLVTSKMWNNPWAMFKKGYMEFGETVEEIYVNIAKPFSYDPATAEKELFKREIPDVRAAFHTMNFQKFYKATISNDQLRQAFLSWQGIEDLIAKIVDSMYTAMNKDEYVTMKYMLCREALNGRMYVEPSVVPTDTESYENVIAGFRKMSSDLTFLKPTYNQQKVENATLRDDQFIIIDTELESKVDVKVLARAFNMEKADFLGHLIIIDSFSKHDTERLAELFANDTSYKEFTPEQIKSLEKINAILVGRDYWMVFDNFQQFTENYNGQGLYWQYFYHTWKTFSVSPFENAVVFSSETSSVTKAEVTPTTANVAQGTDIIMTAAVTGTGLIEKSVTWSVEGGTKPGTKIDEHTGRLHIAKDEPTTSSIKPKATSVANPKISGQATITVVKAS